MTSYYLFQGHRNQRTGAEREISLWIDISGNKKHEIQCEIQVQQRALISVIIIIFSFFFFSSTLRVEKEGRLQISSVTTKRRNFVLRVNTDEPAALTSAPLSHFTLFIRLSATLSRPRPFIRAHGPYFQSTDLLQSTYVSLRMHLANLGSRLTSYSNAGRIFLSHDCDCRVISLDIGRDL